MQQLPKHVSVLTDFGFKKMFGEKNKQFLINLINAILPPEEAVIADIIYKNGEIPGEIPEQKKMVFDIYCLTTDARHVIVELQVASQSYYGDRALSYCSRIISAEAKKGVRPYEIPTIYSINILDFRLPIFNHKDEFFYEVQLKNQYNEVFLPKFKLYFIELCNFARLIEELEPSSALEQWLYIIKNMGTEKLLDCPFKEPIFQDFFEQGQTEKLTPMEKENYKKSIFEYQDVQDSIQYARELARAEGEAEGEARGEAKGRAKEKLAMAKSMLQKGIDIDTIISISGLTAAEICG